MLRGVKGQREEGAEGSKAEGINIFFSEFYKLPISHKLEVFEFALFRSPGNDLERILWLNSQNSEVPIFFRFPKIVKLRKLFNLF
jgi:hypothetical protein